MADKAKLRVAVGYIRVSTKKQEETKLSLIHQREKINAYAALHDLTFETVYDDAAESAKDLERPAMQDMIRRVKLKEIAHIVIFKLDRITRSVMDLGFLLNLFEKYDVTLSSVSESLDTSSAAGKLVVNVMASVAQWERETISERTIAALNVKRKNSERLGGFLPYGYKETMDGKTKMLTKDDEEYPVLDGILRARAGGRGYADIALGLNQMGIRPRKGAQWYASTVRAIVLRQQKEPLGTQEDT